MPTLKDQFGREILSEKITGGGTRYYTADGSICVGLETSSDAEAVKIFNETLPANLVVVEQQNSQADDLIEKIEAMNPSQRRRLKAALLKVQG